MMIIPQFVSGQTDSALILNDTLPENFYMLHSVERDGTSLPEIGIKEVVIIGKPSTGKKFPYARYQRMVTNLKKVYPYAMVVRSKLEAINTELVNIPEDRDRKKYIRQTEKNLFGEYEDDIRDMTITQGRLLIKLIDRDTNEVVSEIPSKYSLKLLEHFQESMGLFVDESR